MWPGFRVDLKHLKLPVRLLVKRHSTTLQRTASMANKSNYNRVIARDNIYATQSADLFQPSSSAFGRENGDGSPFRRVSGQSSRPEPRKNDAPAEILPQIQAQHDAETVSTNSLKTLCFRYMQQVQCNLNSRRYCNGVSSSFLRARGSPRVFGASGYDRITEDEDRHSVCLRERARRRGYCRIVVSIKTATRTRIVQDSPVAVWIAKCNYRSFRACLYFERVPHCVIWPMGGSPIPTLRNCQKRTPEKME